MTDTERADTGAEDQLPDEVDGSLGGEVMATLDPLLMIESVVQTVSVKSFAQVTAGLATGIPRVLLGFTEPHLPERDFRFADTTFQENLIYRRMAAAYALWEREVMTLVDNPDVDWRTRERAKMVMEALTTALAPTNTLPGNPEAVKRAFTTGGASVRAGIANFVRDVVSNGGYPSQVDKDAFRVGRNLATTPGWVIFRSEQFELIQYSPATKTVGTIPLLLLPPPVNKYYFWDLAPGRSMVEYAVSRGVEVYTIVWRDPQEDDGHWGVDSYLASALDALDVVREVSDVDDVHVFGDCSGGMLLSMLLALQEATGEYRIRTGTFGVTVLDFGEPGGIGVTASDRGLETVRKKAEKNEVISASDIASTFVWMRPNDLVWRYLIDEWLLGKKPPAFDIMYWNADGQGMPARFAYDMTTMSLANALIEPGAFTALGVPLDLSAISVDSYHIAGLTDHISPWRGCYTGAQVMGGEATFVLTPTGHVQSIIYPMGKRRAAFWSGPSVDRHPEDWFAEADRTEDSWWEHWVDWTLERSDGTRTAPISPGNATYPPLVPAPGLYVHGE